LDWDDTLFPSTWVQKQQRLCRETGQPVRLHQDPSIKVFGVELAAFLCAASRVGHVFIVTASAHDFVTKCCRVCFPDLLPVLDALKVNIIYARPQHERLSNEALYQNSGKQVEKWKEAVFGRILEAPFLRPIVPSLARFYKAEGFYHVLGYGDQSTDHTALRNAAAVVSPQSLIKTVKARPATDELTAAAMARELTTVGRLLHHLVTYDSGCSYDLSEPAVRSAIGRIIATDSGSHSGSPGSSSPGSRSLGELTASPRDSPSSRDCESPGVLSLDTADGLTEMWLDSPHMNESRSLPAKFARPSSSREDDNVSRQGASNASTAVYTAVDFDIPVTPVVPFDSSTDFTSPVIPFEPASPLSPSSGSPKRSGSVSLWSERSPPGTLPLPVQSMPFVIA
jgi:hypothetical protein